jgi:SAM-dependent methyltransferase
MMLELKDSGHRVVGIDFDQSTRDRAQAQGLVVHDGSVENLPAAILSESFDIVVMTRVLQSCSDPRTALLGVHQLLKTGGHLIADVPNNGAYSARRLGPGWYLCDAGNSLNFFSRRSLARFVENSGFEIVDYFYSAYTGQFRNSRLVIEQKIWDRLYANTDPRSLRLPRRKSRWELWRELLASMFRSPEKKYEMVGVIAKKLGVQERLIVV